MPQEVSSLPVSRPARTTAMKEGTSTCLGALCGTMLAPHVQGRRRGTQDFGGIRDAGRLSEALHDRHERKLAAHRPTHEQPVTAFITGRDTVTDSLAALHEAAVNAQGLDEGQGGGPED